MGKNIEERVVSLKFDNKQFENGVKSTMSYLDKLKEKLKFSDTSKAFENLDRAAKKVDMSGLAGSVSTLQARFSALDVVAVTALSNITLNAMNTGKRMLKALTLDPVMSGFQEYETQMGAIQTILANTQSKGSTLENVIAALDELNTYADKTIYNFTEMTRNIGTFTAAGVELDTSVSSIKGIANLAAISGSTSQQASTAMYQLSQALAAGRVQLMDWNSVVNAGMGGEVFQTALKRTATQMGTNVDALITKYGSFRESLTQGNWLTAEVLTETLTQLSGAYTEADLIAKGYTEKQAKEIIKLADTAVSAATEVKTFTQLFDTLKEAAQSGWAKTWQIIVGDFEEAKETMTALSDFFGGIINKFSDARNTMLEGAFGSKWNIFSDQLKTAGVSADEFQEKLKEVASRHNISIDAMIEQEGSFKKVIDNGLVSKNLMIETLKEMAGLNKENAESTEDMTAKLQEFQKVVSDVWRGDYKNDTERIGLLTEAGYDYAEVQALVNKTVDGHRLTLEDLSDTQLKAVGYTEKEIEAIKQLAEEAEKAGTPLNDLIEQMSKPTGRTLLFEAISNMAQPVITIFKAIGEAWNNAFPPNGGRMLYSIIEVLHGFSEAFIIGERDATNLTRTLKGVFAIVDLIAKVFSGGFKIGFTILSEVATTLWRLLGFGNATILEITATIGDAIVAFRDWVEQHNLIADAVGFVVPLLFEFATAVVNLAKAAWDLPIVQGTVEAFFKTMESLGTLLNNTFGPAIAVIGDFISALADLKNVTFTDVLREFDKFKSKISTAFEGSDFIEIGKNIISGLVNGIDSGLDVVWTAMTQVGMNIINSIKKALGIHSPSRVMYEVGSNVIAGLANALRDGVSTVIGTIAYIVEAIIGGFRDGFGFMKEQFSNFTVFLGEVFADIDTKSIIDTLLSIIPVGVILLVAKRLSDLVKTFIGGISGINDVVESFAGVLKSFDGVLKAVALNKKAEALRNVAVSIAILAGAVIALSFVDSEKIATSVATIVVLSGVLVALSYALDKMSESSVIINKKGLQVGKLKTSLIGIGIALLALAAVVKIVGTMDPDQATKGFVGLTILMIEMGLFLAAYGTLVKGKSAQNMDKAGKMMTKLAFSLLIMSGVIKLVSGMEWPAMAKGAVGLAGFAVFVSALIAVSKFGGKQVDKLGKMILKISMSMILMVGFVKLVASLSWDELAKGAAGMAGFVAFVGMLIGVTKIAKNTDIAKVGSMLLGISASMLIMTGVVKLISMMSLEDLAKGVAGIGVFSVIILALIKAVKAIGPQAPKLALTLLAMSTSIGILAGISILLGMVELSNLVKGVAAVSTLGVIMALMIRATRGAAEVRGSITAMSVAIGVMAASVVALSFIDPGKLLKATAAISALMLMFSVLMRSSSMVTGAVRPIVMMSLVVGLLGGLVYVLSDLPMDSAFGASMSISALMLSMSTSLRVVAGVSRVAPRAVIALTLMSVVVATLGGILYLLQGLPVESTLGIVTSLSTLLLAMSGVLLILKFVGIGGTTAFIGIAALETLIVSLGALMMAVGALTSYIPDMEIFLERGITVLNKIGNGLGSFVGNIVGGFMSGAMSGLPEIGTKLSEFMANATPFLTGAKVVDESSMNGVKAMAEAFLYLTASDFINKIVSFFTGDTNFDDLGAKFESFGNAMVTFSNTITKDGGINNEAVAAAANSGKMMTELTKSLPNEGGILQWLMGGPDLNGFSKDLVGFGTAMVNFSDAISVEGSINASTISATANAASVMVELMRSLPDEGGILQWLMGGPDLNGFSKDLVGFGTAMITFSDVITQGGGINESAITSVANAGNLMAALAESLPGQNIIEGIFQNLTSLPAFGSDLVDFGGKMNTYYEEVSQINTTTLTSVGTAVEKLFDIATSLNGFTSEGLYAFADGINELADANVSGLMKAFSVDTSTLAESVGSLINGMKAGIDGNTSIVTTSITSLLLKVNTAIKDKYSDFLTRGKEIVDKIKEGVSGKEQDVIKAMKRLMDQALNTLNSYRENFSTAGGYIVQGFANGISANMYVIQAKAQAMASAALNAAKKALDINSPSREFYDVGIFAGQGLINAFSKMEQNVYDAGYDVGDKARLGLAYAIKSVYDIIDSGVDIQPTIRPVLDLSDVTSGARTINGMFGMAPSVRLMSHAGAISTSMNYRSQNGVNNELLSAIDGLKKVVGTPSGDTYIIDGITYDDGSNIAEAMSTIVRAARIERRK